MPTPTITSAASLGCGNGYSGTLGWFDVTLVWPATSSSIANSYLLQGDPDMTYGQSPKTVSNSGSGSLSVTGSTSRWGVNGPGSGTIRLYGIGPNGEKSTAATWNTGEQPAYYC